MLPTNPLLHATAPAGPHLPTATLRQYAAGALAPAAQHRVEAHALACPRCADILAGLLQTPPATTDQALVQLQQRLRQRVQQAPAALPATRTRHQHRWLVLQLAAAATLLLGLVAGGWWTWQQRHLGPASASSPASLAAASPAAEALGPAALPTPSATPVAAARVGSPRVAAVAAPAGVSVPGSAAGGAPRALGQTAGPARSLRAPSAAPKATRARPEAMPAAPAILPAPVGGYPAWREKLRREAADFKPIAPEQPLSGVVRLRITVGADGKVRKIEVLHGLRPDYDAEAQRLVRTGSGWVPGIDGGKRAAQSVEVVVSF